MIDAKDRIFVALDVDNLEQARAAMDTLAGSVAHVKMGLQVATTEGWKACIDAAHDNGFTIFCDAKFKDIPNTVESASYALAKLSPDYFTVMADNSLEALEAIRTGVDRAVAESGTVSPKIVAVTVLTSITPEECVQIYGEKPQTKVMQFAENAARARLDAIVCSPEEVEMLRGNPLLDDLLIITPGIRPEWAQSNDQKRSMTPAEAIEQGADMLVIGRPILQPPVEVGSPKNAAQKIIDELKGV